MSDFKVALAIQLLHNDVLETHSHKLFENKKESKVIALLTKEIQYLLDCDFNRLCNIMYRIDIPESIFKSVITLTEPGSIAKEIAELIWKRELQKAVTRIKYR